MESANPERSFLFDWHIQLTLNANATDIEEVRCRLGDVVFHKDCPAAVSARVRAQIAWALRVRWWLL